MTLALATLDLRESLPGMYPIASPRSRGSSPWRKLERLVTLRVVRESSFAAPDGYRISAVPVRVPEDVFAVMAPYAAREAVESFWILPLNAQQQLIGSGPTVITRGILSASLVHPREVFCAAILLRAMTVILCHNHPSGDPTPSPEDYLITAQLVAAGEIVGIPVHDHVIIGRDRYVSFSEARLL